MSKYNFYCFLYMRTFSTNTNELTVSQHDRSILLHIEGNNNYYNVFNKIKKKKNIKLATSSNKNFVCYKEIKFKGTGFIDNKPRSEKYENI